jgi:hypothetical protein
MQTYRPTGICYNYFMVLWMSEMDVLLYYIITEIAVIISKLYSQKKFC